MKTRILSILLTLALPVFAILPELTPTQITQAVDAAGTPEQLTSTSTQASSLVIQARKNRTTANTGNVYVGFTSGVGTQILTLEPGQTVSITAPHAHKLNLDDIWVDAATNADAIIVTYVP